MMAFQISDAAAPMPLMRKQIYQTVDDTRTQETKKVIVKKLGQNGLEEKAVYVMIRVFGGTTKNEDLVSLLVTFNQFKAWAEAKGQWATNAATNATELFTEWRNVSHHLLNKSGMKCKKELHDKMPRLFYSLRDVSLNSL